MANLLDIFFEAASGTVPSDDYWDHTRLTAIGEPILARLSADDRRVVVELLVWIVGEISPREHARLRDEVKLIVANDYADQWIAWVAGRKEGDDGLLARASVRR